jgi:hypothetical protein
MRTLVKRSSLVAVVALVATSFLAARVTTPALAAPTCSVTNTLYADSMNGSDSIGDGTSALPFAHIQTAIDHATSGDCIDVRPGNGHYDETASNVSPHSIAGTYNFGLYLGLDNLLVQGVDGSDNPITDPTQVLAHVTTNSDADFGPDGVFVEGTGDTIQGLAIGANSMGQNKTIESVGENFTLNASDIEDYYGSVYLDDFQYDTSNGGTPHVTTYSITNDIFRHGVSLDIASGPGGGANGGPESGRVISGNTFEGDTNPEGCSGCTTGEVYWPAVSFNGAGTSIPWFTYPVGGATLSNNTFGSSDQYVRFRHGAAQPNSFGNWASIWSNNTFPHGVMDSTDGNAANPRSYSYDSASYGPHPTFPDVERIAGTIVNAHPSGCGGNDCNGELTNAQSGDTLLLAPGTFDEQVNVNKSVTIAGAQAGVDARSRSGAESELSASSGVTPLEIAADDVTVDGVTVDGNTNGNNVGGGVYIAPGHHGTHIVNDIVRNNILGLFLENDNASDIALVQHDLFEDNTNSGPSSGTDIYADQYTAGTGGVNGATIDANSFTNSSFVEDGWALGISNTDTTRFQHIAFSNNTITNHGRGAYFYSTASSSFTDNTFTPDSTHNHYGVGIFSAGGSGTDSNTGITVTGNHLGCASCNGEAVEIADPDAASLAVNRNDLAGPTLGIDSNATAAVDGTCNWWGANTGPTGGQTTGSVTTSPWLVSSNLTDPNNCYGGLPLPKISITSTSVPEGNSGPHPVTLTVSLDHASIYTATVHFRTANGTAIAPSDYTATHGTLTFAPGDTSKPVTVTVNGDTTPENYEKLSVVLSNPSNATLANAQANEKGTITLQNDDLPTLTAVMGTINTTEGNDVSAQFKLNHPYYLPITVDVSSMDGTAHAPGDYTPVPAGTHFTIPAGSATVAGATITVHVNADGVLGEHQEKFTIIGDPQTAGMANKVVTVIIAANNT